MWQTSTIILSIIAFIIGIRIYNSFEMMLYFLWPLEQYHIYYIFTYHIISQ